MFAAEDRLVWAGWKFGFPQMHESYVTRYEPPSFFQDTMGRGRFKKYQHDHYFYEMNDRNRPERQDSFHHAASVLWDMPSADLCWCRTLLETACRRRLALLKRVAENGKEWPKYLAQQEQAR